MMKSFIAIVIFLGMVSGESTKGSLAFVVDSASVSASKEEYDSKGAKKSCLWIHIFWNLKNDSVSTVSIIQPWPLHSDLVSPPPAKRFNPKTNKVEIVQVSGVGNVIVYLRKDSISFFPDNGWVEMPINRKETKKIVSGGFLYGETAGRYFDLKPGDYVARLEYNTLHLPIGDFDFWRGALLSQEIRISIPKP